MERILTWFMLALFVFGLGALIRGDLPRMTRRSRRVEARVSGYRTMIRAGREYRAAEFAFQAEGKEWKVADSVFSSSGRRVAGADGIIRGSTTRTLEEGTIRVLAYPEGRPDLARQPRMAVWFAIYTFIVSIIAVLTAMLLN